MDWMGLPVTTFKTSASLHRVCHLPPVLCCADETISGLVGFMHTCLTIRSVENVALIPVSVWKNSPNNGNVYS